MNYDEVISKRVLGIKPSGIRKFFDIVSEMPDAISLGVGEPDFVTPWEIRDAAIKSVQKGHTAYTSNLGLLQLRKEISRYLEQAFSIGYDYNSEVLVTIGASEAIDLSLRAICEPKDCILVPAPSYVSYVPNIILAGATPISVDTSLADEFKLSPEALESAINKAKATGGRVKALILPYPNNPTGAVMTKSELEKIAPVILKHNLVVLSDEIYAELTYGFTHTSIASLKGMRERCVVISGFSKAFAMTGWRIGYAVAPKEILTAMTKIHQYVIMCASTMSQYAAIAALSSARATDFAQVGEMRDKYDMRRRFLVDAFNKMGLKTFEPKGAFYVFPSVKSTGLDGEEFASKLLSTKRTAVVPGSAFGDNTRDFVRCSYACSMNTLSDATERIKAFIE